MFYGMECWHIARAQVRLNRWRPGLQLKADGWLGPHTQAAIRDFQRYARLNPTGVINLATWDDLILATEEPWTQHT